MILTGDEILAEVNAGRIIIEPFEARLLEPNSYGFHLADSLLRYTSNPVDPFGTKDVEQLDIPPTGLVLERGRFYLGSTVERMGSRHYAAHLYARFSISSCGLFIQTSAPLGHTGAVIPWTLELFAVQDVKVYPGMRLGKICFWLNRGEVDVYQGRYRASTSAVESLLSPIDP